MGNKPLLFKLYVIMRRTWGILDFTLNALRDIPEYVRKWNSPNDFYQQMIDKRLKEIEDLTRITKEALQEAKIFVLGRDLERSSEVKDRKKVYLDAFSYDVMKWMSKVITSIAEFHEALKPADWLSPKNPKTPQRLLKYTVDDMQFTIRSIEEDISRLQEHDIDREFYEYIIKFSKNTIEALEDVYSIIANRLERRCCFCKEDEGREASFLASITCKIHDLWRIISILRENEYFKTQQEWGEVFTIPIYKKF